MMASTEPAALASIVMATESVNNEKITPHFEVPAATEGGCGSAALAQVDEVAPLISYAFPMEADHIKDDVRTMNDEPVLAQELTTVAPSTDSDFNRKILCRPLNNSGGILRNFNSLPLFVYATSTTLATSADGIGVGRQVATTAILGGMNDCYHQTLCTKNTNCNSVMNGLPLSSNFGNSGNTVHFHPMASTNAIVSGASYQQHLNLNNHCQLLAHHSQYSNNYHLHHHIGQEHVQTEQTKSLQELQHEVGALLEFRDLVIETFPDLKHKMASMSSSGSAAAAVLSDGTSSGLVSGTNTLIGIGLVSGASTVSSSCAGNKELSLFRREWEPGIRIKRKLSQKEPCTSALANIGSSIGGIAIRALPIAGELSSSSMSRSRSNSHSGKKEPKSGENNNGSVVQDSGFSTETSSSKDGHSASSTNGAMATALTSNRNACPESDDELMNLLDVIHRKSSRLREEVDQLQKYERYALQTGKEDAVNATAPSEVLKYTGTGVNNTIGGFTPQSFHGQFERISQEEIQQLRKDRDCLLDKLAEMEAETLTGRIKVAKMNDQVEELMSVKKDLGEQLELAMAQKLELSSKMQQLQQQQSKSGQSDYSSSQRVNIFSSAATVLSTNSGRTPLDGLPASSAQNRSSSVTTSTFHAVGIDKQDSTMFSETTKKLSPFHLSQNSYIGQLEQPLGKLDGIVSTPDSRNSKCRVTDSKRFQAILLETNVIELQRHLLTLTVQNQVLAQKLNQATKSKTQIVKRLDRSNEDVEDLRFQLEEKDIELEGTKAQLRVLESRMLSSTPSANTSYTHSQHDYETNRSSASTNLMLNKRGDTHLSDSCPDTATSAINIFSAPTATQISTPSMKAMTHLHMDKVQQHSSSTKSFHDLQQGLLPKTINRIMSASIGGTSPFSHVQNQNMKRLGQPSASSKPSKIPLPGSKAAIYFAGKPPTGRPYTAGHSPPSANISSGSHMSNSISNKSSLSRSTSNLICAKSPNSLKRTDSAQSIRKDTASSLSTSRSSTSSIPMPTTPYSFRTLTGNVTPSTRVLQNSPVPKFKRDSLTSRVRHLDSLSRVHQHNNSNDSNNSSHGGSHKAGSPNGNAQGSYLVASTPKTSIIAQFSSSVRKDLQLSSSSFSHGSQQFLRRATGGNAHNATGAVATSTTRRFSSASAVGARIAGGRVHAREGDMHAQNVSAGCSNSTSFASSSHIARNELSNAADNDTGKVRTLKSTFLGWLKI